MKLEFCYILYMYINGANILIEKYYVTTSIKLFLTTLSLKAYDFSL